jgi:hypothetical protein
MAPPAGRDLYELGLPTPPLLPRAVGCDRCGGTGYLGRVGIFELLQVDAAVRELLLDGAAADAIREAATAAGTEPLAVDAWSKVEAGLTTVDEIRPFLTLLADESRSCPSCGGRVGRGHGFCPLCGGALTRACACGLPLPRHWRFCGGCGSRAAGTEHDVLGRVLGLTDVRHPSTSSCPGGAYEAKLVRDTGPGPGPRSGRNRV